MPLTRFGLQNPTAVAVAVLLVLLFGAIGYFRLPVQLTPELERPEMTIVTDWRAATPQEIEAEIVEPQEEALRGLPGLTELVAQAQAGRAQLSLSFVIGMDMRRALVEVLNRLNQISDYPEDADEPYITSAGADARAIAWFIVQTAEGNENDITEYQDFIEEVVKSRFERVPGVALSEAFGGQDQEIRISFDPYLLADYEIGLPIVSRFAGAGENVSGGFVNVGKREYSLRFAGRYSLEELGGLIIAWRDGRPVYLRDVATVTKRQADNTSFVLSAGRQSIAVNAQREVGVNVLRVMDGLREAVRELQQGPLPRAGLTIRQVYDETIYIDRSIRLLYGNLGLGILLAVLVLWLFLRRLRSTAAVLLAIPVCLFATFLLMELGGRTLNVISLAGLAFAVGMVLDASIIVLENIVRLRERGGAGTGPIGVRAVDQVWGALLASTATTVAVFLPIVFLESEAGQLFADLAFAIAAAICASLLVAVFVVPAAEEVWTRGKETGGTGWHRSWDRLTDGIMRLTDRPAKRFFWIAALTLLPLAGSVLLRPQIDYLPDGNRNLVFAYVQPMPGANVDFIREEMGNEVVRRMHPHLNGEREPQVKHYFFVGLSIGVFMGAVAEEPREIDRLLPLVQQTLSGFPDTLAFARRASLFGGLGEGRSIEVDLQGRDLEALFAAALDGFQTIQRELPGTVVRPLPGLQLARPELRLLPNERRLSEVGWDRGVVAQVIRALGDGLYVGDYFDGEKARRIIVRAMDWGTPEELADMPLVTPSAGIVPVKELVKVIRTVGADEIRRSNRRRTVTLQVSPPADVSLDETLEVLRTRVEPRLRSTLPSDGEIVYRGAADKLQTAVRELGGSFLLAVAVLYLLMSALFRSFLYSILVVLTLPLATVGGVLALRILNLFTFQPLNLLTMIGFIILLGLVVNNAILLVYQARAAEREGLSREVAVRQAVRTRLRPILMSTLTSVCGMLPLVLSIGAGTEIYKGLAAVIVGGMSLSVVFTLLLLPSLLRVGAGDGGLSTR